MADVKWIQIVTDIFDDEKMVAIESLPDGYMIEIVWFKLLCLAGKCNENGFIVISQDIPYTDEAIAKTFRMDVGVVQRALDIFQSMKMIEVIDDVYMVSNWLKYQNGAALEKLRQSHRERQRRYREKQKLLLSDVTGDTTGDVTSDDFCSISIYNNISNNNNDIDNTKDIYKDFIEDIVDYLNKAVGKRYSPQTEKTASNIRARLKEGFTVDDFKKVIDTKVDQWKGNRDMELYLRPSTLFAPSHFEEYLNQSISVSVPERPKMQSQSGRKRELQ